MKKILFGLFLIISITSQGQNIKGKVCLVKDKSPVAFATVALVQLPDSATVTGVITLTDGGYLFEKVKPGNYFLKVRFVGFTPAGKSVSVTAGQGEIGVDTIYLAETTASLNEVTVTAERIKGKELVDRTVYAIPQAIAKSSSNGYDLLKKIPQVNVDFQNNVTLNGSTNFIIQVDGRQRDKEFLAKLLPSDIESIEVVNNPSGKYEGNIDGVLNIILKKEARFGMNGNFGTNFKPFNKPTLVGTGSLDYAMGKITFYVTGLTISQKLNLINATENRFPTIDSTTSMTGPGSIHVTSSAINSGFDYYMNDKNNLSFNISYKPTGQTVDINGETYLYKNTNPLSRILSQTNTHTNSYETSTSLFYKKTFKKAIQELTAEASFYNFRSNDGTDFSNSRYLINSDTILNYYSRKEANVNQRNYLSTKVDYVHPLGFSGKFEAGYQLYYQWLSYVFKVNGLQSTKQFDYAEIRNSVYAGLSWNVKKLGLQATLRVEDSNIQADSVTRPHYACFLPGVNIQYKFSASHNLKLTYNRRINRPGIYDMNPYYKIGQNYNITQGNPDLKPDYRDRMQLTYTWNFGSNYFSPYAYQEYFSDKVGRQYLITKSSVDNSVTTITKPFNLISGYETGGGLNAMLWYVNINARVYQGHFNEYKSAMVNIPAVNYFSYNITSYAFYQFDKNKKTTAILFFSYNGVNMNAQSKTYSVPLYGVGMQKQIKDHNFGVFYLLPFAGVTKFSRTETVAQSYNSTSSTSIDFRNFIQFSYSYKFNKGRNVKKLNRTVETESDSKSTIIGH
jgi:outer membrane receptor protein involved in Fe transport